jgi:hypothetical protein
MNGIGGRTQWYCPSCGRAVGVGGVCSNCGSGGIPEGPIDLDNQGGRFAGLRRAVAGLLGRSGNPSGSA